MGLYSLPLSLSLLAAIHSQFVRSLSLPPSLLSLSLAHRPPSLPCSSPFLYPAEKDKNIRPKTNVQMTYAECKSKICSPRLSRPERRALTWTPRRLYVTDRVGFRRVFEADDAVDPHRRLLYRLTWMYCHPMRL